MPNGAKFTVDGQLYISAATLVWPAGSKHIVSFITDPPLPNQGTTSVQTAPDGSAQYVFGGWTDNANLLIPQPDPVQTITADPRITTLTAKLTVAYRVTVSFFSTGIPDDPLSPPTCGSPGVNSSNVLRPGVVFVGSTCYWATVNLFVQANAAVNLNAIPYPGFVFLGWSLNSGPVNPFLTALTVKGAMTIAPRFSPGKRVHFLTSPLGFNLLIDHSTVPTRSIADLTTCPSNESQPIVPQVGVPGLCFGDFDFAPGSQHVIGAVSPQVDHASLWWVFDSWSNGQGANAIYTTDNNVSTPDTLTANFVRGAQVSFVTNPTGLKLAVDGRQNWPAYNFIWALGSSHQVSAPASESDSKGRQYTFLNWSNGAGADQTVTVDQTAVNNGFRMIASYSVLNRVVVQSSPSGLAVQVDGTACQTPCTIDRQGGTQLHVTAPMQVPMGAGARLDFASWSDGGTSDHTFKITQDYTTVTANYTNSYQLSLASNPANGISLQVTPSSSDMFFSDSSQVNVTATANPGYKFRRWSGDLSGTFPSGSVSMSAPRSVTAQADAVPYIAPAGVRNAASDTPSSSVAPGSIIAIYGHSLAPDVEVGRVNPLAQAIAGVTVTLNDRILGLLFVSPDQINAQVPSDLPDGDYTLTVHAGGQPDVTATFTVARNAPGIFFQTVNGQQYVIALHEDGSPVTSDNPASAGETISVLGTGFGPYAGKVIDGFFPPDPPPALADSLNISAADLSPVPAWTGAAPGYTGVAVTKFQVPDGMTPGSNVPLKVTVNGVDSNTVMLPLQ
ncbi:MAG: hypothetical protein LAP38_20310 [Acidobacteriia bacterium]|nr:hypothetical protein [Terriglobia bacterium]